MTLIEYAEQKGEQRLDFELDSKSNLYEEASRLFTLITAALAGCVGYLFTQIDAAQSPTLLIVVVATIAHLGGTAIYVMQRALGIRGIAPRGNEPGNLLQEGNEAFTLDEIRRAECLNIEAAIKDNLERNHKTARAIKCGRLALILAPLTSILIWAAVAAAVAICGSA